MAGGPFLFLALMSVRATGQVSAMAPQASPPAISVADLSQRPNNGEMQANYPAQALREHRAGKAHVSCVVGSTGALVDCTIDSEEPAGSGFGQATLNITRYWTVRTKTVDGAATQGAVFQRTVVWLPPPS
jgi:protein TonB